MSVVIETTLGDLTVDLFIDERPIACMNFMKLCQLKYYNFNLFHTIQQGFIAQTGDPTGAGDGGSSVWGVIEGQHKRFFEAEYLPKISHSNAGMLSLVSAGKNLVGSQFFFTLGENLTSLDGTHCVIGEVVEGHELLRKLNDAIVDENNRPYQDIRITHTVVLEDPFPKPRGFQAPDKSPSPSAERMQNGRIAADEDIDDTDGKTMEEMQEMLAEREAKARATILEIVGDLPDADMAPPENVLFVCKLNPVTTDDDLEIIFSRFGVVKSCEVIRDRKTGDSLQYAFVEFADQKSCEAAYFKMDNVLIDDRRIHVDFSQSVARVTWRGKGRGVVGPEGKLDFNNLKESNGKRKDYNRGWSEKKVKEGPNEQRSRMSSAERRKAREQRHREQYKREDYDRKTRRSISRERNERRRERSPHKNRRYSPAHRRPENRRSRSREREPERNRQYAPQRRTSPKQHQSQMRRPAETNYRDRREYHRSPERDRKRAAIEPKKKSKSKKSRRGESSSDSSESSTESESDSESNEDTSSSSTDSSDESSSDERSKRKKRKKSTHKKNKSKSKHKAKKKHKK
ncbi:peptidyl-prolyl cis-trans isomerase sig-7 [Scaptodrosophila lebanonensis]|uniref:Peptidyl-prolyl cis-trans isomerase n=1 Tax=Drosophila lebanonensis TaxID=7225 RepID=A0A6J2SZA4_DROLE|nr:peptidyl-prolyl cis-trans isomerase sig-7 [Scaptodrosophila lebanonensis]